MNWKIRGLMGLVAISTLWLGMVAGRVNATPKAYQSGMEAGCRAWWDWGAVDVAIHLYAVVGAEETGNRPGSYYDVITKDSKRAWLDSLFENVNYETTGIPITQGYLDAYQSQTGMVAGEAICMGVE